MFEVHLKQTQGHYLSKILWEYGILNNEVLSKVGENFKALSVMMTYS